jgi:hypothetical protein
MKKKDDAYCNFEGRIYPFSNCSSMNTSKASSSTRVIGYILHSMASGAPGLNSIAWSHACHGGNHFDSSSLNTLANFWYSQGISTFFVYCWVATASSTEVFHMMGGSPPTSHSSSRTISTHSSVERYRSTTSFLSCGLIVQSTIGRLDSSMVLCFQLKRGSYVDNQGYPRRTSSHPMCHDLDYHFLSSTHSLHCLTHVR